MSFSSCQIMGEPCQHDVSLVGVDLEHLAEVMLVGCLCCEVILSPLFHTELFKEGQTHFDAHFTVGKSKAQEPSWHSNQTVLLSLSENCHTIMT